MKRLWVLLRISLLLGLGLIWLANPMSAPRGAEPELPSTLKPWVWLSEPPPDCPFEPSRTLVGIAFTGRHINYPLADTWYPSWADDGRLYSPYTDGSVPRLDGGRDTSNSALGDGRFATTGQAVLEGDDPLHLKIYSLGTVTASAAPYGGRYPCGSLVYRGVWYYGTYCLSPHGSTRYGPVVYNWPWLGPLVGFRVSTDYGRTWHETSHTPAKPLFGETARWGYPVKIGAPHFVDFGQDMEHSPDGRAYLVAHGAVDPDPKPRFANLSWISGDQIYLLRVFPTLNTIDDPTQYEFFAGHDISGSPIWTRDLSRARPLLDWNNHCGCVTVTYNAPLKKYLMCITDGWPTYAKMDSYILEADRLTGPWRLVVYMKAFGEQGYFLNFPSKFISPDGRRLWLCYSANFARDWNNQHIRSTPPGSRYGLSLQEVLLLTPQTYQQYRHNRRPR